MKRNLTIGAALAVVLLLVAAVLLPPMPLDEEESVRRTHAIMREVFNIETTNVWYDVNAVGVVKMNRATRLTGRDRDDYFLVQRSGVLALDEIRAKLDSREQSSDVGSSAYFSEYSPSAWKTNRNAQQLAPWWVEELGESCTAVLLGTNISGTTWAASMYFFARETNTVLCAHFIGAR